jgi:hypothetical protein
LFLKYFSVYIDDGLMMMEVIDDGNYARGEGRGGLQKAG